MTPTLTAVLFDMDGTLIDSEKLWSQALVVVSEELGGTVSAETRESMVGCDLVSSVQMLIDDLGVRVEVPVVQRLLVEATVREFERGLDWRPGAEALLNAVREAQLATALVTSTHRNLTSIALETIGRDYFDTIVCGDDVTRTKPDPEPYQRALAALNVSPEHAVAIEDSPAGSTAAVAAGLATLVVPLEVPITPMPGLTVRESLTGASVEMLQALLA